MSARKSHSGGKKFGLEPPLGGPTPPPPGTQCGVDSTPDELTCEGHAPCL